MATKSNRTVEEWLAPELPDAGQCELRALSELAFPPPVMAGIRFPESAPPEPRDWPPQQAERVFILRREGRIAAACRLVPRRVKTTRGFLDALGLAGVMTHPEFRLRGFGAAVVRAAFAHVDNGAFCAALFQTRVPGFYEKLGCRRVENPFVNSLGANPLETPWWDPHAMVYPAAHPWPEGVVDLLGPAW